MNCGIYIRTSTEEQNPENQIKDCKSLLGQQEYFLYKDQQSAYKDTVERKDFKKLEQDIKTGKINHLYVWDFDRIYRNRIKFKAFLEYCRAYKCTIHSFNQQWMEDINKIPSPWDEIMKDMLIQIFGYLAEEESVQKGRRVKLAMRVRQDGVYSYKGNKWGRKQLSTFKKNRINELRVEGWSLRKIAYELTISLGVVHKYLNEKKVEKDFQGRRSQEVK